MRSDGQLYDGDSPPTLMPPELPIQKKPMVSKDELLIIGLIILLTGDKKSMDLPLVLALVYILLM